MYQQLPTEVFEHVICKFLPSHSLEMLIQVNHWTRKLLLSSSSRVWSRLIFGHPNPAEQFTAFSEKESKVRSVMKVLYDQFVKQLEEYRTREEKESNNIPLGILKYLQEEEFKQVFDSHEQCLDYLLYRIFSSFKFSRLGFDPSLSIKTREEETKASNVNFTNNDHCFHCKHEILSGDWETCTTRKELKRGFRYYWAVHLTNFHNESSNAWGVLIGVDNLKNQPRNASSHSIHYYLGCNQSKGFGYCVLSNTKHEDGRCQYERADLNMNDDVIGVEYYQPLDDNEGIEMKFYTRFGKSIQSLNFKSYSSLTEEITAISSPVIFKPAVSVVSRMAVSLFPWDGCVSTLESIKEIK